MSKSSKSFRSLEFLSFEFVSDFEVSFSFIGRADLLPMLTMRSAHTYSCQDSRRKQDKNRRPSLVTRCSDGTVGPFEWAYHTGYACKPAFIAPSIVPSRSSLPGNIHSSGSYRSELHLNIAKPQSFILPLYFKRQIGPIFPKSERSK